MPSAKLAIVAKAVQRNLRYLPLGLMPLFAGIQQFMEGNVWVGVNTGDHFQMLWGAMGFIFFTWFMWPFWIPFAVWTLEPPQSRRRVVPSVGNPSRRPHAASQSIQIEEPPRARGGREKR